MGNPSSAPGWLLKTANPELSKYSRISRFNVLRLRSTDDPLPLGQDQNIKAIPKLAGRRSNDGPGPDVNFPATVDGRAHIRFTYEIGHGHLRRRGMGVGGCGNRLGKGAASWHLRRSLAASREKAVHDAGGNSR